MAKLVVLSEATDARIEITETDAGYGGICTGTAAHGPDMAKIHDTAKSVTGQLSRAIFHKRFEDAISGAEIHMDVWHDNQTEDDI